MDQRAALLLERHDQSIKEFDDRIAAAAASVAELNKGGAAPSAGLKRVQVVPPAGKGDLFLTASVTPVDLPAPGQVNDPEHLAGLQALQGGIEAVS